MTTPSGTISVQDVDNEFGLGKPTAFSSFRGLGGAPGSTNISLADMRGRSNISFSPNGGSIVAEASTTLSCNMPATWTYSIASGNAGTVSIGSGGSAYNITFNVNDIKNGVGRSETWNVTGSYGGISRAFTVRVNSPSF